MVATNFAGKKHNVTVRSLNRNSETILPEIFDWPETIHIGCHKKTRRGVKKSRQSRKGH